MNTFNTTTNRTNLSTRNTRIFTFVLSLLFVFCAFFCGASSAIAAMPSGGTSTVSVLPHTTLGNESYAVFSDLAPALNLKWSYTIQGNGSVVEVTVTVPGGELPANASLAIITLTDPDTGTTSDHLLGTGGGAILIVLADM